MEEEKPKRVWGPVAGERIHFYPYDAEIHVRCECGTSFDLWEGEVVKCPSCRKRYKATITISVEQAAR